MLGARRDALKGSPQHRTILITDIEGSNRPDRDDRDRRQLRDALYRLLDEALRAAGVRRRRTSTHDLGDGCLILLRPEVPKALVLRAVALELPRRLRAHNRQAAERLRIRLRVAVHAGEIDWDENGPLGGDLSDAFRLLDSAVLRERLRAVEAPMVLVVSRTIYHSVVQRGHGGIDPASFVRAMVHEKELDEEAWVHVPAEPADPDAEAAAAGDARPRRRWIVAAAAGGAGAVLLAGGFVLFGRGERSCGPPTELRLVASATMEPVARRVVDGFEESTRSRDGCLTARVTVAPMPSAAAAVDGFLSGWSGDQLRDVFQPDAWLADSNLEVERVRSTLARAGRPGTPTLRNLGSVASSPLVVAVPASTARALAWPDQPLDWKDVAALAGGGRLGGHPFVLGRPSPSSSTIGLLATAGLYQGALGRPELRAADLETPGPASRIRAVERGLADGGDDQAALLCRLESSGNTAGGDSMTAVVASEQAVASYNQVGPGECAGGGRPRDPLRAFYPSDGTPELDFPLVEVSASWNDANRAAVAASLSAYLRGEGPRTVLADSGFRVPGAAGGGWLSSDNGVLLQQPTSAFRQPDETVIPALLDRFEAARRPARVLVAMDVSGSMKLVSGSGGTRIEGARDAAARAVSLVGDKDAIGLWRFSTRLNGSRDYQELVPLGSGATHRERLLGSLAALRATDHDTGLYDTIDAGVRRLRQGIDPGAVNALVVLTDGENDDPQGIGLKALRARLDAGRDRPVQVVVIAFGSVRCQVGGLDTIARMTGGSCHDADRTSLRQAFEEVATSFWGGQPVETRTGR
jgi:Ca-activated chloride channel family protein